jgi:hypothetical protein
MGADEYTAGPTAVLNVQPKQLAFYADVDGPNPDSQVLHIENAGYVPLLWDIAEDCPWLAVTELPDGTPAVCLDVNVIGVDPGRYDCEVAVTADHVPNSPQLVSVSLYLRSGRLLYVPWPYDTIQDAIEAARDGDAVIVQPGTYTGQGNRDIDFLGKTITVRSTDPNDPGVVAGTIIYCGGTETEFHRGFIFRNGEDANSILAGLTITDGQVLQGGGIYIDGSSPTILHCNISDNLCASSLSRDRHARKDGGGIYIRHGNPHVEDCVIASNRCEGYSSHGGGIFCYNTSPVITGCYIASNEVRDWGAGVHGEYGSTITVSGCTITNNRATFRVGGGICLRSSNGVLSHCLVAENQSNDGGGGPILGG